MGAFQISKNGYFMYKPSWQQEPGARMKAANRAAAESYYANFSSLGGNFLTTMNNQTASSMELTTKIVTQRLQSSYNEKLEQAKAGFDVTI